MRKKQGFEKRSVCGEKFLIAAGLENMDFDRIITLNETAEFIWDAIPEDQDVSIDDLVAKLTAEYEVSAEEARQSVAALVDSMSNAGLIVDNYQLV